MDEVERLIEENRQLRKELEAVRNESKQYLQNVAHQLTAPLGAIKWSIEGLTMRGNVSLEKRKKLLSSIYSQATILVHLIKNFTLMSNLEVDHELGQFREKPEKVDLLRLCINLASDFQPQAADKDKKIVVDDDSFNDIPGVGGRFNLQVHHPGHHAGLHGVSGSLNTFGDGD
jgi:signal transduction histidine kinase